MFFHRDSRSSRKIFAPFRPDCIILHCSRAPTFHIFFFYKPGRSSLLQRLLQGSDKVSPTRRPSNSLWNKTGTRCNTEKPVCSTTVVSRFQVANAVKRGQKYSALSVTFGPLKDWVWD
ncbi:hypothetical protein AMECASPLE_027695 [Ameca splendens]|uniref:Uncharacterized protein n=1 Tax=Ameca splendens TaxID=208324 RepID=A0ABV1A1V0_9TELE